MLEVDFEAFLEEVTLLAQKIKVEPGSQAGPGRSQVEAKQGKKKKRLAKRVTKIDRNDKRRGRVFVHVTSRSHLGRKLIVADEIKEMLGELCRHYCQVCGIELHHYCIMDNHLHLVLALPNGRGDADLSLAVGCIKQQFSRHYKRWYNTVYRKQKRHRPTPLGKGTLWDGPFHQVYLDNDPQLASCIFYVEANRLKVTSYEQIQKLLERPCVQIPNATPSPALWLECQGALQPCYEALLEKLRCSNHQSASWYLRGCQGHEAALTDGTDVTWATDAEVKQWWKQPAHLLPRGWRRVWIAGQRRIAKPTPEQARRYPQSPLMARLGATPEMRGRNFGRLLMGSCFKSRSQLNAPSRPPSHSHDFIPGVPESG
ncbi:MAG: transposase [Bradymonadaceae bacterium]|nr:transposase [Lujinxingiaceae bacterium]